jgi:hypothetical protein
MEDCCNGWIAAGWQYRCKTYGATGYSVLWCRARQAGDPSPPEQPGCAMVQVESATRVPLVGLGAALLLILVRLSQSGRRGHSTGRRSDLK